MHSVYTTLLVSMLATVIATIAGTFAAIGFYGMRRRARTGLMTVNNIPMMNADIVTGVSLCLLFVVLLQRLAQLCRMGQRLAVPCGAAGAVDAGLRHAADRPRLLQHSLRHPVRGSQAAADGPEPHGRGAGSGLHLDAGVLEGHHPGDQAGYRLRRADGVHHVASTISSSATSRRALRPPRWP